MVNDLEPIRIEPSGYVSAAVSARRNIMVEFDPPIEWEVWNQLNLELTMPIRQTHTFAILELSPMAYEEIARKLREAGYDHAFDSSQDKVVIDMNGIGVQVRSDVASDDPIDGARADRSWPREQDMSFEIARKYRLMAIYGERVTFTQAESALISEFLAPRDMKEMKGTPIAREDRVALRQELPPPFPEGDDASPHDDRQPHSLAQERADIRPDANRHQVGGAHYGLGARQHWDIVTEFNLDYFQGQITKYLMRWKRKNGLEDLRKAQHFLEKYIEVSEQTVTETVMKRTTEDGQ